MVTNTSNILRRDFFKASAGIVGAAALTSRSIGAPARGPKPNVLFIMTDQQHIDSISRNGCNWVNTPAMDSLCARGVSFTESYSTNPVCSPARSSAFTGRMPCETGVHNNGRPIISGIPNLGQWLGGEHGYEAVYAGKWHLPGSFTHKIPGHKVLTPGVSGQGCLGDTSTSYACEHFLRTYSGDKPFILNVGIFQPHDICQWLRVNRDNPDKLVFDELKDQLPDLPSNYGVPKGEPQGLIDNRLKDEPAKGGWSDEHWRYYRWCYFRMIEQFDAEIGRILQALDDTGLAKNTLVILTSDHGEGLGHHNMVRKNFLYDEAAKVPMVIAFPGRARQGVIDREHLVSGVDIMPTICDYAGVPAPPKMRGSSMRPLAEGKATQWRPFVVTEATTGNRMVRTKDHKFVAYNGDPNVQLFDRRKDPGEINNIAATSGDLVKSHKKILADWESKLDYHAELPDNYKCDQTS